MRKYSWQLKSLPLQYKRNRAHQGWPQNVGISFAARLNLDTEGIMWPHNLPAMLSRFDRRPSAVAMQNPSLVIPGSLLTNKCEVLILLKETVSHTFSLWFDPHENSEDPALHLGKCFANGQEICRVTCRFFKADSAEFNSTAESVYSAVRMITWSRDNVEKIPDMSNNALPSKIVMVALTPDSMM